MCVEAFGVHLPEERVSSASIEARLAPLYARFHLGSGQLEAMTGIRERRYFPAGEVPLAAAAAAAAEEALAASGVDRASIGVLIYAGVSRANLEPATACPVAHRLGLRPDVLLLDVANACLGVLNGMAIVANMIELGQVRAGLVVAAESAREIADDSIERLLADPTHATFRLCFASLTGGSGAAAVLLTHRDDSTHGRRLVGGVAQAAPEHHGLARWGPSSGPLGRAGWVMETDAPAVLTHGVALSQRTWARFLPELGWRPAEVDRVICHQVGSGHRDVVLPALGIDPARDFSTFTTLGNMGPVAIPVTALAAARAGFLEAGDRVGLLGIGTGLNCMMLGMEW